MENGTWWRSIRPFGETKERVAVDGSFKGYGGTMKCACIKQKDRALWGGYDGRGQLRSSLKICSKPNGWLTSEPTREEVMRQDGGIRGNRVAREVTGLHDRLGVRRWEGSKRTGMGCSSRQHEN